MMVNGKMIIKKGRGYLFIQMATIIQGNSRITKCQAKGNISLKMEVGIIY